MQRIVKVVSVVDTREFVEDEKDQWVPIPGSGTASECGRCGREHEVHATVELEDGTTTVVGTGCMAAASMALTHGAKAPSGRRFANAAKRVAALRAEALALAFLADEYSAIRRQVEALPLPPVEIGGQTPWGSTKVHCGDATVYSIGPVDEERHRCAVSEWQEKRERELGATRAHESAPRILAVVLDKLEDAQDRLTNLTGAAR